MTANEAKDIVLVTGSTAIDLIGVYSGSFDDYQAQYNINALNTSFQLTEMKTSFGGCAPNIAYGLNQLGVNVIPLSSAGRNFKDRYQAHLEQHGINVGYIMVDEAREQSASCVMINDLHGNQIIGFYPGPLTPKRKLPSEMDEIDRIALAVLAPENAQLMLRQARDLAKRNIPLVFDPGQVITDFQKDEIHELLGLSHTLIANDYEYSVLKTNGELTDEEVLLAADEVVITHGEDGVGIFTSGQVYHVDSVPGVDIIEVTGCGDAFRAGYVYGVLKQLDPVQRGQIGCIMAALNLRHPETQGYPASEALVTEMQREVYG